MDEGGRAALVLVGSALVLGGAAWHHLGTVQVTADPDTAHAAAATLGVEAGSGAVGVSGREVDPAGQPLRPHPNPDQRPSTWGNEAPTEHQLETAAALTALYAEWDDDLARSIVREDFDVQRGLRDRFAWFRERLGSCDGGHPSYVLDEERARFVHECEHGALELQPRFDEEGKIAGLRSGARGLPPPARVTEMAPRVLELIAEWDLALYHELFADHLAPQTMRERFENIDAKWGRCELAGVDLVSSTGALFDVACERGPRLMIFDLDEEDRVRRFIFRKPRPEDVREG